MIERSEGTIIMQHIVETSKELLSESGYLSPILYIFNTKKSIHIDEALLGYSPTVAAISQLGDDTIFKNTRVTKDPVYLTMITFNYSDKKDEDNIKKIMNLIASTLKPDMMGVVLSVLFRSFTTNERDGIPKSVLEDPSAVRMLHSIFYTKDEKIACIQNTPYVNRGVIHKEVPLKEDRYDVTFVDCSWVLEDKDNIPRFKNPYNQRGLSYEA